MKEILEKIYNKEINNIKFKQEKDLDIKQTLFSGEIYETNLELYEPIYIIEFIDKTEEKLFLDELIAKIFNYAVQINK